MKQRYIPICLLVFFLSCAGYSNLYVEKHDDHSCYFFPNLESDKLLIYIEGSGLGSVLGVKKGSSWKRRNLGYYIVKRYNRHFNIMIPEKLQMEMGKSYSGDRNVLYNYTYENLVESYAESINRHLSENRYSAVYLVGCSEGGLVLPGLYSRIQMKDIIRKIVIWGGGGLGQYEAFKILGKSEIDMPEDYRNACLDIEEAGRLIDENPDSIDDYYLGWPYRRWSSFFRYNPSDYLSDMKLPVLFIHGLKDWHYPVESTQYAEKMDFHDEFEFRYYPDMGHGPENVFGLNSLLDDIFDWIRED